jgi:predicted lipoprotein
VKRRDFLNAGAAGALLLAGCRRQPPPSREGVLRALVHEVVVPDTAAVVTSSNELSTAVQAFAVSPSLEALKRARSAFTTALLAWKQAQCFRNGPMVETNAFVRTLFWPPRPEAVEAAAGGASPLDEAFIANLGVDARGVYALEYLLFPLARTDEQSLASFVDDAGKRRRELCSGLAASIAKYAGNAGKALGDGNAYAARFAEDAQVHLSILVNQLIGTVENLAAHRLEHVLRLEKNQRLVPREVEGWPSGTSQRLALVQLAGNERIYRGGKSGGLAVLTAAAAPAIGARVSERYGDALRTVRALPGPLEVVVKRDPTRLAAAAAATKALELALKVDLASALGVTITFQTGDGD